MCVDQEEKLAAHAGAKFLAASCCRADVAKPMIGPQELGPTKKFIIVLLSDRSSAFPGHSTEQLTHHKLNSP